ncbi:4-hydroxy-tetrahydrodipicolinate synthase [Labeo rohita]|nr:4-hydroxy-tetrahydrodipicolinate synthase [Labeo rohita]
MKLKKALRDLLAQYPEGVILSKARRSCPLLLTSEVLDGYASVRQLLESMPDVVTLRGLGVQTFLFPAGTKL